MNNFLIKFRFINRILSIFILVLALYIVYFGLEPEVRLAIVKASDETSGYVYNGSTVKNRDGINTDKLRPIPQENRVVIPRIYVNSQVWEGQDEEVLDRGVWRRPNTSTPELGGNTVLTAHRFLYRSGPNTFFHLDDLEIGDEVIVFWKGSEYLYKINSIDTINPDFTEVEKNTDTNILTLYTCTPLYTSDKRLVLTANLESIN